MHANGKLALLNRRHTPIARTIPVPEGPPPMLLTIKDIAGMMQLSSRTVRRLVAAGELPGIRLGSNILRFDRQAVEEWLRAKKEAAQKGCPRNEETCQEAPAGSGGVPA